MKKLFFAIVAFVVVLSVSAQDKSLWFGGEVGVGVSKAFAGENFIDDSFKSKLGFDISARAEYSINDWLYVGSGLGYQRLSDAWGPFELRAADNYDPILRDLDDEIQMVYYYHALKIPLNVNFHLLKRATLGIGLNTNIFLSRTLKVKGSNEGGSSENNTEYYKKYYPSYYLTAGYDILSKENYKLNIKGFYEYSANTIDAGGAAHFQYYGVRTAFMF